MDSHENCASRLHDFVSTMMQQPPKEQFKLTIIRAFGVQPNGMTSRQQSVWDLRILRLLDTEYDALVQAATVARKSDRTYAPITHIFDNYLSVHGLGHVMEQCRNHFQSAQHALLMFAEFLPDDGVKVPLDELSNIEKEVEELRKVVIQSKLPTHVVQFVEEQLGVITRAILDYKIAGARAFISSIQTLTFIELEHESEIAKYEAAEEVGKLRQLQQNLSKISKYAIEVSKFLNACKVIGKTVEFASNHLPGFVDQAKNLLLK